MENHVTTNFIWADGLADFLSNGATLAHLQCTGAPPFGTRFKKTSFKLIRTYALKMTTSVIKQLD